MLVSLLAFTINGLGVYLEKFALSPNGSFVTHLLSIHLMMLQLVALLAIPFSLIALVMGNKSHITFMILWCCIVYVFISFIILRMTGDVRLNEFQRLAIRSSPLIKAISFYTNDKGHPPEKLDDLVPQYLPRIPTTGIGAYPNYTYEVVKDDKEWYGNSWVVYIETPRNPFNWDKFIFFPNQNYPKRGFGGYLEKIENWAYVHE